MLRLLLRPRAVQAPILRQYAGGPKFKVSDDGHYDTHQTNVISCGACGELFIRGLVFELTA
jgi:hypothetical protein